MYASAHEQADDTADAVLLNVYELYHGGQVMSLIVAENVHKVYRTRETEVRALKGVSCVIGSGAFVSIVGPSGSGKTTLLNLIGCLDKPSDGRLTVAGTEIAGLTRVQGAIFRGEKIGFIFQDFNLIPILMVYENIEYPLLIVQDVPARQRAERVLSLLKAVGMEEQKDLLLQATIDPIDLLVLSVIVIVISVVASLQPAFKASRMEPIKALRHI